MMVPPPYSLNTSTPTYSPYGSANVTITHRQEPSIYQRDSLDYKQLELKEQMKGDGFIQHTPGSNAPFTVSYLPSAAVPQAASPQNQALLKHIQNLTRKGAGGRSYVFSENYTERKMLEGINALSQLMHGNLETISQSLGQAHHVLNSQGGDS